MRGIRPFYWFLAIPFLSFLISFSAHATPAGKFSYIKGRVDITSPGQAARPAALGDEINVGDIVRAKSESKAEITFVDGNILRLAQSTRIEISQYMVGEDQTTGTLKLFRGKVQSIVKTFLGKIFGREKNNLYEIHTPTAVCGVRGTNFFTWYTKGVSGAAFKEGQGYGYSSNRPEEVREIKTGEAMLVVSPDAPPMVRPATDLELELLLDDTAPTEGEGGETGTGVSESGGSDLVEGSEPSEKLVPTLPPQAQAEGKTGFWGTLSGGVLESGTFSGVVKNKQGEGSISLSGNFSGTPSGGYTDDLVGAMTDGSALKGYLGSAIGSYEGVFSSLYLTPAGGAGYLYGGLSGDLDLEEDALSANGSVYRSAVYGQLDLEGKTPADNLSALGSLDEDILPILGSINAGGGFTDEGSFSEDIHSAGMDTTSGRKLGVWGVNTSSGKYSNELGLKSWSAVYGEKGSTYYSLGTISGSDDLKGRLSVSGTLTYLDNESLGTINLWYRGAYQPPGEKEAILDFDYDSAGVGTLTLDPLGYGGTWGTAPLKDAEATVGCLYYNDEGYMTSAGNDYGLLGGLKAPWANATSDLYAVGAYTGGGPDQRYLFNTSITGSDPVNDLNLFQGYTGGFWKKVPTSAGTVPYGTLNGTAYAVYMDKDGNAGFLKAPGLSGYFYPDIYVWSAVGTWNRFFKETVSDRSNYDPYITDVTNATLAGNFDAESSIQGAGSGTILFLKDFGNHQSLPWGIYDLKLAGSYTSTKKLKKLENWSALAGGEAVFGYAAGEEDNGYWLADAAGTWSDEGEINGSLSSGIYLAKNQTGSLGGPFYGTNNGFETSGTWIGQSIGTFEGQPLAFSGETSDGSLLHYNGYSLVGGTASGLMGSLDDLWSAAAAVPASLRLMGEYDEGWETGTEPVFSASVKSHNPYDGSVTIWNQADNSPNGAYYGFIGGRGQEDYQGLGMIRALYLDRSGNAGFLKGQFDVKAYPDLEMWEATSGSIFPMQMISTTNYNAADLHDDEGGLLYTSSDEGPMVEQQGEFPATGGLINWLSYKKDKAYISSSDSTWRLGVTSMVFGGNYYPGEGSDPDLLNHWIREWDTMSDEVSIGSAGAYVSAGDAPGAWSDGLISGKGCEAWVNWNDAVTGVSGADLKGTFDPTSKDWQASALWAWMDTKTFLSHTGTAEGRLKLEQLNIPCVEVGKDTLTGTGGYTGEMTVNMVDTTFFAYSTGAPPRIWASGNVNGSGSAGADEIGQPVSLHGMTNTTLQADFVMKNWDTSHWTAHVNNGEGTVGGHPISFKGAAAGTHPGDGTFNGTASGVAGPQ